MAHRHRGNGHVGGVYNDQAEKKARQELLSKAGEALRGLHKAVFSDHTETLEVPLALEGKICVGSSADGYLLFADAKEKNILFRQEPDGNMVPVPQQPPQHHQV